MQPKGGDSTDRGALASTVWNLLRFFFILFAGEKKTQNTLIYLT